MKKILIVFFLLLVLVKPVKADSYEITKPSTCKVEVSVYIPSTYKISIPKYSNGKWLKVEGDIEPNKYIEIKTTNEIKKIYKYPSFVYFKDGYQNYRISLKEIEND